MTPAKKRSTISAFIVCMNEEQKIRRCLESVLFCDEIVVVDSGSTDQTLTIAKSFGAKIFERPWPGFVEQKRFGLEHCQSDWVINIDADEEVSPGLRDEILKVLERDAQGQVHENGFELHRLIHYLGAWWRKGGWYPEFRLRLLRRTKSTWGGTDPHEHAVVEGLVGKLNGDLFHYTYDDIANHIRSVNSHASAAARTLVAAGRKASLNDLMLRPVVRFVKFYFFRRGYREGMRGFIAAVIESFYVFVKYAKVWEHNKQS